jgi:hypothetical protein
MCEYINDCNVRSPGVAAPIAETDAARANRRGLWTGMLRAIEKVVGWKLASMTDSQIEFAYLRIIQ